MALHFFCLEQRSREVDDQYNQNQHLPHGAEYDDIHHRNNGFGQ